MKTSSRQFTIIVDFMETHGDLNKCRGSIFERAERLKKWKILSNFLNEDPLGNKRNIEKWKKVWSDLKNNCKRKRQKIIEASPSPGHLNSKMVLNDLEKRVLKIIGLRITPDGHKPVGVESKGKAAVHPEQNTPAPTTVEFVLTEQNSQMFDTEMSEEKSHFTSTEGTSGRSSDASSDNQGRLPSPQPRNSNNHRHAFSRSRSSRAFEASDSRWHKLFSELSTEHLRLRKIEHRQQKRWQHLLERCIDCIENIVNK